MNTSASVDAFPHQPVLRAACEKGDNICHQLGKYNTSYLPNLVSVWWALEKDCLAVEAGAVISDRVLLLQYFTICSVYAFNSQFIHSGIRK